MSSAVIEIREPSDIDKAFVTIDRAASSALKNHQELNIVYGTDKKMSAKQRGSLHVWCQMVADTLNDAGLPHIYSSKFTKLEIEMDWTMYMIKDMQYKPVLEKMTGKLSTEHQNTVDPSDVANVLIRKYSEHGVVLPAWPSKR